MSKVTIIIPVYNVEKYLEKCLDSVLTQTYSDYDVICVNDCSPDQSQAILDRYEAKYSEKLKVLVNEQNMGQGRSRERALAMAKGEYILFVDSDDYIAPDYIETYLKAAEESGCDVVVGGYTRDVDGELTRHMVEESIWTLLTYSISCAKLYRRSFLIENNIGYSAVRKGEDIYFGLCLYYHGATFKVIDYAGYYYYFNRQSTTGAMRHDVQFERMVSEMFDIFLESHDISCLTLEQRQAIEYTYLANMVNALITYGRGAGISKMKEKYAFFVSDLKEKFSDYKKNPYVGIFKPVGQTLKIRLGVGVTMGLHKIHLDKVVYYLVALL